jgi:hypothetical protein
VFRTTAIEFGHDFSFVFSVYFGLMFYHFFLAEMDSAEEDDANVRFKTSFSVRRFENAMKCLTPKQKGFLFKHGYDMFLNLKHMVVFPLPLIDWIIDNIIPRLAIFQRGNKHINFNEAMIQQFIAIPSGILLFCCCFLPHCFCILILSGFMLDAIFPTFFLQCSPFLCEFIFFIGETPVKLSSDNPEIEIKFKMLKAKYTCGGTKIFTKQAIEALKGDEDEESFMRTFHLVLLATIVCPATSNTVEWRFLYSLTDLDTMKSIGWSPCCLEYIITKVEKFEDKLSKRPDGVQVKYVHVGGCLPFLAVSSFTSFYSSFCVLTFL